MINFDDVKKENIKKHNSNWPQILDRPYRILIVGGSRSGKINAWLNLISRQLDTDKIYSYAKDPYEPKYRQLINRHESSRIKNFNDLKPFIE